MRNVDKLVTVFLVAIFTFAGGDKLMHYHGFVNAINSYRILPIPMGSFLAPIIIAAELSIAVGLLASAWRRIAALQATVLMALLTLGLVSDRLLGNRDICGCWFSVNLAQGDAHFLLNAIMLILSFLLWKATQSRSIRDVEPT